jgi:hypothetical protein
VRRTVAAISCCLIAALVALPALLLDPATADAARSVPPGFVGVVGEGPLLDPSTNFAGELDQMVGAGVETLRISFPWIHAQPYARASDVPVEQSARFVDVGGVPTDWSFIDGVVRATAIRRIRLIPVVVEAPPWAAAHPGVFASPPKPDAAYSAFVGALAERYGSRGTFWAANPALPKEPIRQWQIWNEPNIADFWSDQPSARDYVALLRRSRSALRQADPGAKIVLAGLVNRSWAYLRDVYRAGGRRYFDTVAVHPFTAKLSGVLKILRLNRKVMAAYGDARKPMIVTELTWTSAAGQIQNDQYFGFEVNELQQAARVRVAYERLAAERRSLGLVGVFWFSWLTEDSGNWTFFYAGLRSVGSPEPRSKPAFGAFRDAALGLEGCRRKNAVATSCTR